jgi:hypothetical protein
MNLSLSLFISPFLFAKRNKNLKKTLGSYINKLKQYVQTFQHFTQLDDMTWKGIMLLLEQTLTSMEKQNFGAGSNFWEQLLPFLCTKQQGQVPKGDQAVPLKNTKCGFCEDDHVWERNHFIYCIIEELRKTKVKALNYSQLAAVHQGDLAPLRGFLQQLKDAIQKHTNVDTQEEEIIPKDKFLTQSAWDILRKTSITGGQGRRVIGSVGPGSYCHIL